MSKPIARYLDGGPDGRLHLQHGPIDLVIGVDDGSEASADTSPLRSRAFAAAVTRFETVLDELVAELPLIRAHVHHASQMPAGSIARRMVAAVRPFCGEHFITPMAAVAGAVADEVLTAIVAAFDAADCPARIYVNNGGDIALHLAPSAAFRVRMAREDAAALGSFAIHGSEPARGIATSGRGGRSLSMGIADSVTIIGRNAAAADAAATIVANAVDIPGHPAIRRARAVDVVDDSDLGERLVVNGCGPLLRHEIDQALDAGLARAEQLLSLGLIDRAGLFLHQSGRLAGHAPAAEAAHPFSAGIAFQTEHSSHA